MLHRIEWKFDYAGVETLGNPRRRAHRPGGDDSLCTVCFELYLCTAVNLLAALEQVESVARSQAAELSTLRRHVAELEAKISRAAKELS
jgi:hypothetical protein